MLFLDDMLDLDSTRAKIVEHTQRIDFDTVLALSSALAVSKVGARAELTKGQVAPSAAVQAILETNAFSSILNLNLAHLVSPRTSSLSMGGYLDYLLRRSHLNYFEKVKYLLS
jgi:hypothetical protein